MVKYLFMVEIKRILADHIKKGIAPFRGLHGNSEFVTLNYKEEKVVEKLLAENKSIDEIVSLFHQGKLQNI